MSALSPDARICIIGAGAGGLSAAWYLRQRGYRHITVLEKADQVGGKCRTLVHDGVTLELGAVLLMPNYRHVLAIADELGAVTGSVGGIYALRQRPGGVKALTIDKFILGQHSAIQFLSAATRYLLAHGRHRAVLRQPGFARMSTGRPGADLALPFGQWASARGMAPLLTQFLLPIRTCGYGDIEALPAAYVLRYITAFLFTAMTLGQVLAWFGIDWPKRLEHGYGDLLERMSAGVDVRLAAGITRIDRGEAVRVSWSETSGAAPHEETFDRLVIACPPSAVAGLMDCTAEEARLFPLVRTDRFSVTVCKSTGVPAMLAFPEADCKPGHLMNMWKPVSGPGPCLLYANAPRDMSEEDVIGRVRADLLQAYPDATLGRVVCHTEWDYFPRVDAQAFAAGFFDDLEALQGAGATWYCGALLAFESVENVFAYSKALVDRMIGSAP